MLKVPPPPPTGANGINLLGKKIKWGRREEGGNEKGKGREGKGEKREEEVKEKRIGRDGKRKS